MIRKKKFLRMENGSTEQLTIFFLWKYFCLCLTSKWCRQLEQIHFLQRARFLRRQLWTDRRTDGRTDRQRDRQIPFNALQFYPVSVWHQEASTPGCLHRRTHFHLENMLDPVRHLLTSDIKYEKQGFLHLREEQFFGGFFVGGGGT